MATEWISPTWRMPEVSNQSKFENYSLDFDSGFPWLELESTADPLPVFTPQDKKFSVSMWIKPDDATPAANEYLYYIMSAGGAGKLGFWLDTTGKINFRVYSGVAQKTITSTDTLSDNTWYHIVGTWDGNTINLYIDGVSAATPVAATDAYTSTTGNTWATFGVYRYGGTGASKGGYYTGEAGQLAIWNNIALSESQISYLYNSGTPINPMAISGQPPVAYYPLGGGSTGDAGTSPSTLTVPNESVPSATVFDYPSGGADWIDIGNSLSLTSAFTLSSWVKTDTTGASNIFYKNGTVQVAKDTWYDGGAGNRANITLIDSNGLSKNFRSNVAPAGATVTVGTVVDLKDGEWHQIVFSYDGVNQGKLYTDGDLTYTYDITDGAWAGNLASNSNNIYLGGTGSLQSWTGELSNAQIWETVLTGGEVTTLYNNGVPLLTGTQPEAANLKAWYKLNVDTSTWDGTDWLLSNSGITPTYTTAVQLPNAFQNPPLAWPGLTRSDTSWSGTDITLSFWVRYPNGYDGLIDYIRASGINIGSIGSTNLQFGSGATYRNFAIGNLQNTAWHNVVVYVPNSSPTFLISDVRCWIDGSEVAGSNIGSGTASQITTISGWGANSSVGTSNLSNWTLFNSDLTGSISTLYNGGTPADVSSLNPVSWYKCDSTNVTFPSPPGTSMTFTDSSSNSNNATGAYDGDGIGGPFPSMVTTSVQAGDAISDGMTTANLVTSDLTRSIPYSSYSMELDGTADFIDLGTTTDYDTGDLSASIWVNASSSRTITGYAFSNSGSTSIAGFDIKVKTNEEVNVSRITSTTSCETGWVSVGFIDDAWQHLSFTYKESTNTIKLFLNGELKNTTTGTTQTNIASKKLTIGSYKGTLNFWDGKLSNAAIWTSELTQDQILTIYNGGVPNSIASLSPIGWWSLAGDSYYNGTDWICPDLGSGGNNGTSSGMGGSELVGDAPGGSANGTATNMDIPTNLKGDAPNSSSNAFSVNMGEVDRVESVPS